MIDPTIGVITANILAVTTAVSLLAAGIHLVPTKRTHGILVLMAAAVMMATFVMVQPAHNEIEALVLNGLASLGSVGAMANVIVVTLCYGSDDDRDSYVIRRTSLVAVLSGAAALSATLSVLSAWDSPWRIGIVAVLSPLAVIVAAHAVIDAPERSTV